MSKHTDRYNEHQVPMGDSCTKAGAIYYLCKAVGFKSSFLLACLCFVLASLPMMYLFLSQGRTR